MTTIKNLKKYSLEDKKFKIDNLDNKSFSVSRKKFISDESNTDFDYIILVNGKPRAVIEVGTNTVKTFSYEDSTIDEMVPERHVFMGKTYCYGKIFSPFMNMGKSDEAMSSMMNMMMMNYVMILIRKKI